mmetsp:Transcript_121400/g.259211  ORF Transcript_121400/g.259211 Transcript_121400/m.259211 type:complete len:206 (+) Transcript_121400:274-891(+)
MKPAWDQLGETWKDSTSVLIGDVDCTSEEGKSVCSDIGVSGYPTIKYFGADTGREGADYKGGRSFEDLNSFVEKELAEDCDIKTKSSCSEEEVAYITKMTEKSPEKLGAEAKRLEGMTSQAMKDEKRKWLNQRISILEQMLGKKVRKKRSKSWLSWPVIGFGVLSISTVAVGVYFLTASRRQKAVEKKGEGEEATAPKEEEKKND